MDAANPPDGKITAALRRMVALPLDQRILIRTHAEKVAFILLTEAEQKKLGAIAEVVDRCEGRAHVSMTIDGQPNPLEELIRSTTVLSERIGPPEEAPLPELSQQSPKLLKPIPPQLPPAPPVDDVLENEEHIFTLEMTEEEN